MNPSPSPFSGNPSRNLALTEWGKAQAEFRLAEMEGRSKLGPAVKKELLQNTVQFAANIGADVEELRGRLETSLASQSFAKKNQILTDFWVDFLKERLETRNRELGVFKTDKPDRASIGEGREIEQSHALAH